MKNINLSLTILLFFCFNRLNAQHFNGTFAHPDAKGQPQGWDFTYSTQNKAEVKLDSLVKQKSAYSVSMSTENLKSPEGIIVFPIHKKFSGKTLTLVANIKTENVKGGFAGVWMRTDGMDDDMLAMESMESQHLSGTNDWKEYYIQMPYDETNTQTINVGALLMGKGKMWVENLRLYLDEIPINDWKTSIYPALKDTILDQHSGIDTVLNTPKNIRSLNMLGQLWGFLKYHHPAIAKGDYNWDAALFRIMPAVLAAKNDVELSAALEKWVDGLGKVPPCVPCKVKPGADQIAVKPDYGDLLTTKALSKALQQKLRYISENSNNQKHYYVNLIGGTGNPQFDHERLYSKMKYPDAGFRLLALFRYWATIQYFCPNRKLTEMDWNQVLTAFIPQVIQDKNKTEFMMSLVKLVCAIRDTHGFIVSDVYGQWMGKYRLPFQAGYVGNQLVVGDYYLDTLDVKNKIKPGDIITSIDGAQVKDLIQKYLPYSSASNFEVAMRDLPGNYLLRSNQKYFKLNILRDGKALEVTQEAPPDNKIHAFNHDWGAKPGQVGYELLDNQIGYIRCNLFKQSDMPGIKKLFEGSKGIVVDMRNYPIDELVHSLGSYFKSDSTTFITFSHGSVARPGLFLHGEPVKNGQKNSKAYPGKVVILVNEMTQSNAEFVTMAFQSAANVRVIGSTTSGADGNISAIHLPGGFATNFSGLGVYYPDGTNAQRKGVKIDLVVQPSIQGIKDGKDEVLEKGKELILQSK